MPLIADIFSGTVMIIVKNRSLSALEFETLQDTQ